MSLVDFMESLALLPFWDKNSASYSSAYLFHHLFLIKHYSPSSTVCQLLLLLDYSSSWSCSPRNMVVASSHSFSMHQGQNSIPGLLQWNPGCGHPVAGSLIRSGLQWLRARQGVGRARARGRCNNTISREVNPSLCKLCCE